MSPGLPLQPPPHLQREKQHGPPPRLQPAKGDPSASWNGHPPGEPRAMPHQKGAGDFPSWEECFCLRMLYWWGGEGITAASPGGRLCWRHQKLEKGGKNELKMLELCTRSYNEKLQNFRIEKWLADNAGEVHSCYWVTTKSASEGFFHLAEKKTKLMMPDNLLLVTRHDN